MKAKTRAALLSGLVLPGLGQWILGRKKTAVVSAAGFLVLLAALAVRTAYIAYEFVTVAGTTMAYVHREVYGTWWLIVPLLAVWAWSIADALRKGKSVSEAPPEGQ